MTDLSPEAQTLLAFRWKNAAIDDYKPLENTDGWDKCPVCKVYPRVWIFNNGNYAKCLCSEDKYGPSQAEAPSIIKVCHTQKRSYDDYKNLLRDSWNLRCQYCAVREGRND